MLFAIGLWHEATALALLYCGGAFIVRVAHKAPADLGDWIVDVGVLGLILWTVTLAV